jgi:hypothetical protein
MPTNELLPPKSDKGEMKDFFIGTHDSFPASKLSRACRHRFCLMRPLFISQLSVDVVEDICIAYDASIDSDLSQRHGRPCLCSDLANLEGREVMLETIPREH